MNSSTRITLAMLLCSSTFITACGESSVDATHDVNAGEFVDPATTTPTPPPSTFIECSIDSTCGAGMVCRGFCIDESTVPGTLGGSCDAQSACGGGLECDDNVCVDPASLDLYYDSLILTHDEFFAGQPEVLADSSTRQQGLTPAFSPSTSTGSRVDLSSTGFLPRPGNQGNHGSCLAFAAGYGLASYLRAQNDGNNISRESGNSRHIMSAAYLYNTARSLTNSCGSSGTHYSNITDALEQFGIPTSSTFPYSGSSLRACTTALSDSARSEALSNRVTRTERLFFSQSYRGPLDQPTIGSRELSAIKAQLNSGRPVVISLRTTNEMKRMYRGGDLDHPITPYTRPSGQISHGYHAMLVVGYDDSTQRLKLMNSWGRGWGDGGFMTMSYSVATHTLFEAWVATRTNMTSQPTNTGCNNPRTACSSDQGSVVRTCSNGTSTVQQRCDGSSSCVESSGSAYCATTSSRCSGRESTACGRSQDGSTFYVVETCDGAYLSTLEQCDSGCSTSGGTPQCDDVPATPDPAPTPSDGGVEVRIEWQAGVDIDMHLTEEGVGTYSYRGTPRDAGRFENWRSCRNSNEYCSDAVTSIERVVWPADRAPRTQLELIIENYDGTQQVPARLVVSRNGDVVAERDITVPAGRRARTAPLAIILRD